MAQLTISGTDYASFASVDEADAYLAADPNLYAVWAAYTTAGAKERALVGATRYMAALCWASGEAPDYAAAPDNVKTVAIILASSIAQTPSYITSLTGLSATTSSKSVKSVKAGSAEVEFFESVTDDSYGGSSSGNINDSLPTSLSLLIKDLLCDPAASAGGVNSIPFDGGDGADKCPSACEYGVNRPYN